MRKRTFLSVAATVAVAPLAAACGGQAAPAAVPTVAPPPRPTAVPMANKLVLYGDTVLFADGENLDNCVARSRFKRGEGVGFRMTAVNPLSGEVADTADLIVKLASGEQVPMRFRGTGPNPHPGMWTARWTVPDNAPLGITKYTVEAKDKNGSTGTFAPFNVDASMLTIVP